MPKVLITTVPFGDKNRYPLELLSSNGIDYVINPLGKKLTEPELSKLITDCDAMIAGTEPITDAVLKHAKKLKLISRVGIGLDSVDLLAARRRNIAVSYTPDAPAPAVAELTIGLMFSLVRHIHESNIRLHDGGWHRFFGKRLTQCRVGLIGVGRIGRRVFDQLSALGCSQILYNDINLHADGNLGISGRYAEKDEIFREADIISIHVPLTARTKNMITAAEIDMMKRDACIINTARGGIVNENDIYEALKTKRLAGAAVDVFETEPYFGRLSSLDNCILTAHMGSMTIDCRTQMEIEATEEVVRFLLGGQLEQAVPKEEFEVRVQGA